MRPFRVPAAALTTVGTCAAVFVTGACDPQAPATSRRPNVVFVLTDDQRWDAISLHGGSPVRTPNIDRIGREGIYFRNPNSLTGHKAELYRLTEDPNELVNLIDDPRHRSRAAELHSELDRQLKALGAWPDLMPVDEGIGQQLPEASIR
jgi:arylsulfatase A-like enzyme